MSSGNENGEPPRRSSRNRTQRTANPGDFLDEEGDDRPTSKTSTAKPADIPKRAMPARHRDRYQWRQNKTIDEFSTVDGDKIMRHGGWRGSFVSYKTCSVLFKGETALLADQDEQVALEIKFPGWGPKLTQVPYHADMLPAYDYWAQGLQQHSDIGTFKISNFHLPPSPWLGDSVLPTLKSHCNNYDFDGNMTSLELSNCGLSGDDLEALATFLSGNETLCRLNLSRNIIGSVATCKTLAKAIKANPSLLHVNLSHCSLGGGNLDVLEKILVSCKGCKSLDIGHSDFDSESVSRVAKFLGKKIALTSFSLVDAKVDRVNKRALETSLTKNKTIKELSFRSNGLLLPGFRSIKKVTESLGSRLTTLELSHNSLPVQGARGLAKFLTKADTSLTTLILTNNHLTTKGANILLPVIKEITSLQNLDLSDNWLNDQVAPAVIDLLANNSTLLILDLSGNRSLKTSYGGRRHWWQRDLPAPPKRDGGRAEIVKKALLDTSSFEAIANSNHTCAVRMAGTQSNSIHAETIRRINALEATEAQKIRYKVVLAITDVNKELYDPCSFSKMPLELMPHLLSLVQQEIGCNGFGRELVAKSRMKKGRSKREWSREKCGWEYTRDPTLTRLYEVIMAWQSLPLLFVNGAGELPKKKAGNQAKKKKSRKRRRFGDEDDDDDEPYIPRGGRKRARWEYDPELRTWVRRPPPAEFA